MNTNIQQPANDGKKLTVEDLRKIKGAASNLVARSEVEAATSDGQKLRLCRNSVVGD